jgi:hypothetical protein
MRPVAIQFAPVLAAALIATIFAPLCAQQQERPIFHVDSDHDGMSDDLEQSLLVQFAPTFMIGRDDCSNIPAEFTPGIEIPEPLTENGTIYGQVFPLTNAADGAFTAEIHYYHLWRKDCGGHGHPLDTEHVAVLVKASDPNLASAHWKAVYWYAAAHEDTVCDVSQITRAATVKAEDHGARVWVSPGKHASYLDETLCQRGCGADKCQEMVALAPGKLINLGEVALPMNGSVFIASKAWPLAYKMSHSNFPVAPIARLNQLPDSDIAWFNAGRHPAQGIIAISSKTEQALAGSAQNTTSAVSVAGDSTGAALSTAGNSSGNALQKSYRLTKHALGISVRHVGEELGISPRPETPQLH